MLAQWAGQAAILCYVVGTNRGVLPLRHMGDHGEIPAPSNVRANAHLMLAPMPACTGCSG